jgi:hypothetical protein
LAELKQQEAESYREKYEGLTSTIVEDKKFSAVKTAAIQAGIRKDALDDLEFLSLEDVVIETTSTGRHNILGAEQFIAKLKTTRPHWFSSKTRGINADVPEVTGASKVTSQEIIKAENEARKSGDWAPVKKLYEQYTAQRS